MVATRVRPELLSAGIQEPENLSSSPAVSEWVDGGRARHPIFSAGKNLWLLKAYRRGGMVPLWNADRYWSRRRFLRELETAVRAVQAGVPTIAPIALVLRPAGWAGAFRAWQVVPYLPGVRPLREFLNGVAPGAQEAGPVLGAVFQAAGAAVRRMHEVKIDHPDLHIGNILVRLASPPGEGSNAVLRGAEAFIVDWDKARYRPVRSWNPHRNLFRLWRSALKQGRFSSQAQPSHQVALRAFLRGYFGQNRVGLRKLRRYVRLRFAQLSIHAVFWNLERLGKVD